MLQIIISATSPACLSVTLCYTTADWSIYHSQHIEREKSFTLLSINTHKLFSFRELACRAPSSRARAERKHGWYEFLYSLQSQRLAAALLHQGIPGETDNLSVSSYLHSEPPLCCSECVKENQSVCIHVCQSTCLKESVCYMCRSFVKAYSHLLYSFFSVYCYIIFFVCFSV